MRSPKDLILNTALAIAMVFSPIKATLITVMVLTALDLVSGLLAAIKRKEPITSTGLKRTVIKILAYETTVMLGYLVQQYMTGPMVPVVNILAGLIGITELKSVLENIESLTGITLMQVLIDKLSQQEKQ